MPSHIFTKPVKYLDTLIIAFSFGVFLWIFPYLLGKYVDTSFPYIHKEDIVNELVQIIREPTSGKEWCQITSLFTEDSEFTLVNNEYINNVSDLAAQLSIRHGGIWQPHSCQSKYKVVLIIPYRNRPEQLKEFLRYIHVFLQKQQIHYRIFVIEQSGSEPFNRAKLLNVGYKEAKREEPSNICFIFHDVDLLPKSVPNIYTCTYMPRHMCSSLNTFRYHLPYRELFGGAIAMLSIHFEEVNGFSNMYAGWGGEDDDLALRLQNQGLTFVRFDPTVATYYMMPHKKLPQSDQRFIHLSGSSSRQSSDGLSSLDYEVQHFILYPLHTHIVVSW